MKKVALLLAALVIASCGSIVNGSKQSITVETNVKGAEVYLDDKTLLGNTPLTIEIERKKEPKITIKKEGYKSHTMILNTDISGWFWMNILIGGTTGSSTDSSTGGRYNYAPSKFFIDLAPEGIKTSEKATKASQLRQFVLMNYDRLNKDIAEGKGEYLNSIYEFYGSKNEVQNKEVLTSLKNAQAQSKSMIEFADKLVEKIS